MSLFGKLKQKMTGSSSTGRPKDEAAAGSGSAARPKQGTVPPAAPAKVVGVGQPVVPYATPVVHQSRSSPTPPPPGMVPVMDEKKRVVTQPVQPAPPPLPRRLSKSELLKPLQPLSEAPPSQRQALLCHKLRLCCIMFEWDEASNVRDARPKEAKRQLLLELLEFMGKNKGIFTESVLVELMNMVKTNLFRSLPPKQAEHSAPKETAVGIGAGEGEEEEPVFEPAWPHLQIVYELFLRFIVSTEVDIRTLKKYINGQFVLKLLELFDSEDAREREYLKTILHRIYAKFMSLRAFIRKAINNVFYTFIYDNDLHNGIAELLEILGSIINGFAVPLKQEHKTFLKKVLLPMHKVKSLANFHQQLTYCVTQFIDKDPTLAVPVIMGLIKFWPVTNSSKEVLFLNELEEVLDLTQTEQFKQVVKPLFTHLCKSVGSPHFQVAERALFLWHNEYISGLIADFRADILPIIYHVLYKNAVNHWNPTVTSLTLNVLKIFQDLDPQLLEECHQRLAQQHPECAAPPLLNIPADAPLTFSPSRTGPAIKDKSEKLERWARLEASIPRERIERFKASVAEAEAALVAVTAGVEVKSNGAASATDAVTDAKTASAVAAHDGGNSSPASLASDLAAMTLNSSDGHTHLPPNPSSYPASVTVPLAAVAP